MLDDGRTICVSTEVKSTYCFDTVSREWRRARDWALPLKGRASYVADLDAWLGFSSYLPRHLCAMDQSVMYFHGDPALQHVWEDPTPDVMQQYMVECSDSYYNRHIQLHCEVERLDLLNMGGARFCIAKVYRAFRTCSCSFMHG